MSTLKNTLIAAGQQFDQAFNQKQPELIGKLYAEDAVVLPAPAGEAVTGRQAIVEFFSGLINAGVIEHQLTLDRVTESATLAVASGKWAAAMLAENGEKQSFGGNVQVVYQQQTCGTWLAVSHLWN